MRTPQTQTIPMNNDSLKRDKFVSLAEKRVNKVLSVIRSLGNLSNSGHYEYEGADAEAIIKALNYAVADLERRFEGKPKEASLFRFKARSA